MPAAVSDETLKGLLGYAILAPSSHNVQPWKFKTKDSGILVFVDRSKALAVADPEHRELFISLGCAIANIVIAAGHFAFSSEINFALKGDLAAEISFEASKKTGDNLFGGIEKRRTSRLFFESKGIPEDCLKKFGAFCEPGIKIFFAQGEKKGVIAGMVEKGDMLQFNDPAYRKELAHWIKKGVLGQKGFSAAATAFAISNFNLGKSIAKKEKQLIQGSPVFAILVSAENNASAWLRAGMTFEKISLLSELFGIQRQPMNQGLIQIPENREKLKGLLGAKGTPVFAFRLGYGMHEKTVQQRQPLQEFLI